MAKELDFDKLKEPTTADDMPEEDDIEIEFDDDEDVEPRNQPDAEAEDDEDGDEPSKNVDEDDNEEDEEDVSEYEDVDPDYKKYGKRAQKRIRKLVAERKERDRQLAEMNARLEQLQNEGQNWQRQASRSRVESAETLLNQLKAERNSVRKQYERAFEEGNGKELSEAQDRLNEIAIQSTGLQNWINNQKSQLGDGSDGKRKGEDASPPEQENQPQQPQPPRERDQHQRRWLKTNRNWFGKDRTATQAALSIHQDLLHEGFNPADEDDDEFGARQYYKELDTRLRQELPHKFEGTGEKKGKQTVAGPARSPTKKGKNVVTLSKTERELAKRLGVSEKAYAREKLKKMKGNSDD